MKQDIQTAEDISLMVEQFYKSVLSSAELAPFFASLNWDSHLPKMKSFWRFVLLDEAGYTTNVTEKHLNMRLSPSLFKTWITLFDQTVDANFEGEKQIKPKHELALLPLAYRARWAYLNKK